MRYSAFLASVIGGATLLVVTACQNAPVDQGVEVERCRRALVLEFGSQTGWGRDGKRPAPCRKVSEDEFARLADEVTGSQRNPGEWDQ